MDYVMLRGVSQVGLPPKHCTCMAGRSLVEHWLTVNPKGEEPDDADHGGGMFRAADAIRPLTLKNTDNKAIAGVHSIAIVLVLANQ